MLRFCRPTTEDTAMPARHTDTGRFRTAENSPMPIEKAVWMQPEVMSGELCFRDTRIAPVTLFKLLARGTTIEEYVNAYGVHPDAIAAGRLVCEAAKRQLPRERASAPARQRAYPLPPTRSPAQQRARRSSSTTTWIRPSTTIYLTNWM